MASHSRYPDSEWTSILRAISWQNNFVTRGRLLAIDHGTRNIGLACCDEMGLTVRPLPSVRLSGIRGLLSLLRAIVQENEIRGLVVGIPYNMDGSAGQAVRTVERFIEVLQKALQLPVNRVDERLSTWEAMEYWNEMGPKQQRRYRTVDSLSAALILERYLKER